MPRKQKLKNPHMPTGKEPGVQYVNLSPNPDIRHFSVFQLAGVKQPGFHTAIITVWLTKDETAYNPDRQYSIFQGPGKVKYTIDTEGKISAEFVASV